METAKKQFNKRAFISNGLFFSMFLLPLSGIMNHYLQFEGMTMDRHFWMSVHNMTAVLFTVFFVLHIVYNWRPLLRSIKTATSMRVSKEGLAAISLIVLLVGIFASHVFHVR